MYEPNKMRPKTGEQYDDLRIVSVEEIEPGVTAAYAVCDHKLGKTLVYAWLDKNGECLPYEWAIVRNAEDYAYTHGGRLARAAIEKGWAIEREIEREIG